MNYPGDGTPFPRLQPAYRYLARLYQATRAGAYHDVLKASADSIWNLARNPSQELYAVSWAGPPMTSFSEPQETAATMALNLFAGASGPYPGGGDPGVHEAEDATIWGVGLEATHGAFSGWGYVAGWRGDGQQVDFRVTPPAAGLYELAFRYAAGAGAASRFVSLDGLPLAANLSFPGTGSWDSYGTVNLRARLSAGTRTVSVAHESARGSANFLNLDRLELSLVSASFRRGDANADGRENLSDAISILSFLFLGDPSDFACPRAADSNDDGRVNIADAVALLGALFLGTERLPEPFAACGIDPTPDGLSCEAYPPCG